MIDLKQYGHPRRRTADDALDTALTGVAWLVAALVLLFHVWGWLP